MPKGNWKSLALLGGVALLACILLAVALVSLVGLPLMGWTGLAPLAGLLLLTLAASRFTISVNNSDGHGSSQKSVADAFIFLAAMMYIIFRSDDAQTLAPLQFSARTRQGRLKMR